MGFLRRVFGLPRRKEDKPKADKTKITEAEIEKWLLRTRFGRMGNLGTKHIELQFKDLLHVLNCVTQEIEVLKDMLKQKGQWNEDLYQELRIKRMIDDHSLEGLEPWKFHSIYPYTLEESEFLHHKFEASDEEVKKFEGEVERVLSLT